MTTFAGYGVDLDDLDDVVAHLTRTQGVIERLSADLDRQMAALHDSWSGLAAESHLAAHAAWERHRAELSAALAVLAGAARTAHESYAEAAVAGVRVWQGL